MKELHFVCTDFPGPKDECVFVECEDENGHGVNAGEWKREGRVVALVAAPPLVAAEPHLARIEAACGLPDPAVACHTILALCREARLSLGPTDPAPGSPVPDGVREAAEDADDVSCYHCGASHWCSECQGYADAARGGKS